MDIESSTDYHEYVSIVISLVITIINIGIQMSIMYLHYLENEFISSVEQSNIALKIGIGQLLNSIGVPLVVAAVKVESDTARFLAAGGLVEDVFYISLFSLFSPIGRFIDPFNILLKIQRSYYEDPEKRLRMVGGQE